jgi:lysyl-tRNA synthetase class 2
LTIEKWRPTASLDKLKARAQLYQQVRGFFRSRGLLEVETPVLSRAANTDPHIVSLEISGQNGFLQSSPEFAMKRLLASGCGPIFQICKAFRQGESGRRHNPEFTLLEWYQPEFDHFSLMSEVAQLVNHVLGDRPVEQVSYRNAFQNSLGIDPYQVTDSELAQLAKQHTGFDRENHASENRDTWLDLLMSHVIEPELGKGKLTFIYHYPASQCALAKLTKDEQGVAVAERFELYVDGMELANGYHELTDANEQQRRFDADQKIRQIKGLQQLPSDFHLVAALEHGLPECAGVALGLDRLLMLKTGASDISQVLAFDGNNA